MTYRFCGCTHRQELEERHILEAEGGQLAQQLQAFSSKLPWIYQLQTASLSHAAAHHMTLLDHLALAIAQQQEQQQQQQGMHETFLLSSVLAQHSNWAHLQLLPLGLEIYRWVNHNLTGLATEDMVRSTSLHQYLQRATHKDRADSQHMLRLYQRFKHSWNAFHKAKDGYMRHECNETAKFEPITDNTPLAFFVSWQDEAADDYILKVLKNVLAFQNSFMADYSQQVPSANIHSVPASLLRDSTLAAGMLDGHSLQLEAAVSACTHTSTSPSPTFDLHSLVNHVIRWMRSKHSITDDLSNIRHIFQPWQAHNMPPDTASDASPAAGSRQRDLGLAQGLSAAYKQPLAPQQASLLTSHIGRLSFEQVQEAIQALQQVAAAVAHQTPLLGLASASSSQAATRCLQPGDLLSAAVVAANPDSKLKCSDFVSGLGLSQLHAVLFMASQSAAAQNHQYVHLPHFIKTPLPEREARQLRAGLQADLRADPQRAEELDDLLRHLHSYQDSALPAQAKGSLCSFCSQIGFDQDTFPLSSIPAGLRCEHYVADH